MSGYLLAPPEESLDGVEIAIDSRLMAERAQRLLPLVVLIWLLAFFPAGRAGSFVVEQVSSSVEESASNGPADTVSLSLGQRLPPAVPAERAASAEAETVVASAGAETCEIEMRRSSDALNVATYFSWYRTRTQYECMSSLPIEGFFKSKNRRRIRSHLRRLGTHGFDAIAGVVYADPRDDTRAGLEMRWMLKALREARRLGFEFIPLYDFSIASHLSANLCNVYAGRCTPDDVRVKRYNFDRYPVLQDTVYDNLVMIADRFILPFSDLENPTQSTARFLHDSEGRPVLDDFGLPRPEVYIYIPRVWFDNSGFRTIGAVLDRVTDAYRERGLGMPAYTLDVLMPFKRTFNVNRVAAFGEAAVRITPFFAASGRATDLGELTREHERMYRRTQRRLARAIRKGKIHPRLQIAAGTVVNFDKRGWSDCQEGFNSVAWPALEPEDWQQALESLVEYTTEPVCRDSGEPSDAGAPFRNGRFLYADEGFEATWLCAEEGPPGERYPNRYGCEPLEGFYELMQRIGER